MPTNQSEKGQRFQVLHHRPGVFLIPNPWDAGSARILAGLGFEVLTSSLATESVANIVASEMTTPWRKAPEGRAHSKTLARVAMVHADAKRSGVRAALRRFRFHDGVTTALFRHICDMVAHGGKPLIAES